MKLEKNYEIPKKDQGKVAKIFKKFHIKFKESL